MAGEIIISISKKLLIVKQQNGKNVAILNIFCRLLNFITLCLMISLNCRMPDAAAQADTVVNVSDITELQQVEITGYRHEAAFSENSRVITTIRGSDIEKAGVQTLQDLLEYASNIDIRQRGLLGVQSDVSIRGGSFDQVMILMNGINLSDPQTGHASLDIPIDKEGIERIEILEGSSARLLGPGAFTGAINIVTKRGTNDRLSASQVFGSHGFLRTNLNASLKRNSFQHFMSAGISSSKGYITDTDFNIKNAFYRGNYSRDQTQIDLQAGFQDKKFGAAGFYSPRFPNQYEETGLWFASLRATSGDKIRISPSVYMRHRKDHFVLERDVPEFYQNFHLTRIFGSQINFTWRNGPILTTAGFDLRSENIISNNLGFDNLNPVAVRGQDSVFYTKRYGRDNLAYFQEHNFGKGRFDISGGFMINWNSAYPDKPDIFPGLDFSYRLFRRAKVFFSLNRGLNFPTFTDLFYTDPVNQGNILLDPNRIISFEGGIKKDAKNMNASLTYFRNTGRDMIDWLWSFVEQRFSPINLRNYEVNGLETNMILRISDNLQERILLRTLSMHYVFMDIRKSVSDSVSKYYNIRHKVSFMIRHGITKRIEATWTLCYQDRSGEIVQYNSAESNYFFDSYKPYWLLDGAINWTLGSFVIYAMVNNMLNTNYIDAGSVMQPGRWFKAGITVKMENRDY